MEWSAPADNGASITDYDVRYCTNSTGCTAASNWTALDDNGNNATSTATTVSISGLTNGTTYQVQVRAGNSVGDGDWSASATEKPSTVPGAPAAAPTLTVGDESLGVEWSAPSGNGGSAVTGYKVGRCSSSCSTDSSWTVTTLTSTGTTTTLTGLTNGTAYQVRVRATNRSGDSSWSTSATATPADEPAKPSAPTVAVWNKSLRVSWTAPANNGASITDYDVRHCVNTTGCANDSDWTKLDDTGNNSTNTATTATISSLTNGTAYRVQVRAGNSVGDGPWSDSTNATPAAQKPEAPGAPTLSYGDQSLSASWSAPADNGASITDYDVRYCINSTGCDADSKWTALDDTGNNATSTATSASITGLTNGTSYQVQVRAGNSVGDGAWSASATEKPSTVPTKPAAPTLTVQNQSLDVEWAAPSGDGGSAVTGYKVGPLFQQLRHRRQLDGDHADEHRHHNHAEQPHQRARPIRCGWRL